MRMLAGINRLFVVVSLAILMWACDGGGRSSIPTSPSAQPAPSAALQSYTLSGVVSERTPTGAAAPVEGVLVEETNFHQSAITDGKGAFSIAGVSGPLSISMSKSRYFTDTLTFPAGANYMDLRIVLIPATYTLSGLVSEMTPDGRTPVEGVLIEGYTCAPRNCHVQTSTTDRNGLYSIGLYAGQNGVWVTKEGYEFDGPPALPACDYCNATVTLNGDTRFDIQLVRR